LSVLPIINVKEIKKKYLSAKGRGLGWLFSALELITLE
jgi:hypothetical protein